MSKKYYMIRTGSEFVSRGCAAIGWNAVRLSDPSISEKERLQHFDDVYSKNAEPRTAGRIKGQIKRFLGIKEGDLIVTPCHRGFYVGTATGQFEYVLEGDDKPANRIIVDYKKQAGEPFPFARDGKKTALASKLAVRGFTVLELTEKAIQEELDACLHAEQDFSDEDLCNFEENKRLALFRSELGKVLSDYREISLLSGGRGFEALIRDMFQADGFTAEVLSKKNGEGEADADILAVKASTLGAEFSSVFYIQAKHHWGQTSHTGIQQIIQKRSELMRKELQYYPKIAGGLSIPSDSIQYVLISSGSFSDEDKNTAAREGIILIDGEHLAGLLYDKMDLMGGALHQLGFIKVYERHKRQ